jgi:predicted dehydrogenase
VQVSGGLFRDMMIHDVDMAGFQMGAQPVGAQPVAVSAVGSALVDPAIGQAGDADTAVVTLSYADGRIAVIKTSRRAICGYDQRLEVLGSTGLLQTGNVAETTVVKSGAGGAAAALIPGTPCGRPCRRIGGLRRGRDGQGPRPLDARRRRDGPCCGRGRDAAARTGQPVRLADV